MALDQIFTSPDGALSFRYPSGWNVVVPEKTFEEGRRWEVRDAGGEQVLSLSVRPDQDMYKVSPPLTPLVIPQGEVPGVVDKLGTPTLVAVVASPGQCAGCDAGALYGMTSATGADPVYGDIQWGERYLLSFGGSQMLGPTDEVDMAAEAEQFATSARFRTQILPILQSLAAAPSGQEAPVGSLAPTTPTAPAGAGAEAICEGAKYTYENLQGVTCQEAKAIMQVTMDTGEPFGARSHRSADHDCYETSCGERLEDSPHMMCWVLDAEGVRGEVVLEANYR